MTKVSVLLFFLVGRISARSAKAKGWFEDATTIDPNDLVQEKTDSYTQGRRESFGNKYVFPLGRLALRAHEASLRGAHTQKHKTYTNVTVHADPAK